MEWLVIICSVSLSRLRPLLEQKADDYYVDYQKPWLFSWPYACVLFTDCQSTPIFPLAWLHASHKHALHIHLQLTDCIKYGLSRPRCLLTAYYILAILGHFLSFAYDWLNGHWFSYCLLKQYLKTYLCVSLLSDCRECRPDYSYSCYYTQQWIL